MECKVLNLLNLLILLVHWNISRMECKELCKYLQKKEDCIGIYPEWNVKPFLSIKITPLRGIGIYPEWNVKQERYAIRWHMGPIGIYPEWNVKGFIFNVFKKPV